MFKISLIMLTTLFVSTISIPAFAAETCGTVEGIANNKVFKGVSIRIENICFDGNLLTKPVQLSDLSGKLIAPEMKSRKIEPLKDANGNLVGFIFSYFWGFEQAYAYRFDVKRIRYGKIVVMINHASKGNWAGWQDLSNSGTYHYEFSRN